MKIGVISDSHDNVPRIRDAVAIFNQRKTGLVIHAGDLVAPFSIRPLQELNCEWVGVFGNNDGERLGLSRISGDRIKIAPYSLVFNDKKLLVLHEPGELDALIKSQAYDIIIYGHTHEPIVEKHDRTLVINPGESGGWLNGRCTVAVINLDQMDVDLVDLS